MAPQRRYLSNKEGDEPQVSKFFDLICEDSWRNVYAGELEVRPPGAPTTTKAGEHRAHLAVRRRLGRGYLLVCVGLVARARNHHYLQLWRPAA
jgi:hypothetical protein